MSKPFFRTLILGASLGAVIVGWFSPSLIAWYFTPPVQIAITCKEAVSWGIETYRKAMLIGAAVGAATGVILFLWFKSKRAQTPPAGAVKP